MHVTVIYGCHIPVHPQEGGEHQPKLQMGNLKHRAACLMSHRGLGARQGRFPCALLPCTLSIRQNMTSALGSKYLTNIDASF